MNALVRASGTATSLGDTIVVGAEITAGHDGTADLVVQLQYPDGLIAPVVVDGDTGLELIGAGGLDSLVGRSWREILKGL